MSDSVTFLMPVYNGMAYLAEAIDSVLRQPGANWKLLIVDDRSTDATWEYVNSLRDPRIQVARNTKNLGLYGTLNEWVHHVESTWTAIIFQDDRLEANYLQRFLEATVKYPQVCMFWGAIHTINDKGTRLEDGIHSNREELIQPSIDSWASVLLRGTIWTISGSWSRTLSLKKYGFRPDLPHLGDYDYLLRSICEEPYLYLEVPLTSIREHSGQASTTNLATFRDLRERSKVIGEQLQLHAGRASLALRMQALSRLVRSVAMRALGKFRRREWRSAWTCVTLLPQAIFAAFRGL